MAPGSSAARAAAPIRLASSLFVVACYVTLAGIAYARYPLPYSPVGNWLSDLGNPSVSPAGAPFYNAGIALAAVALLAFFLTFLALDLGRGGPQRAMTYLTVGFGCAGSLAMLMTAVYPIDRPAAHSLASLGLYFGLGTAFAFSVAALRYHRRYPRRLLAFGVLVALADLVTQVFLTDVRVMEWANVALLLGYCLALGIGTRHLGPVDPARTAAENASFARR